MSLGNLHGKPRSSPDRIRGAAFVEFVIVAPLILFLGGYSFRFAQQLQAQQVGLVLAREYATRLFIECADFTIQPVPQPNNCGASGKELCVDYAMTTTATLNCITNMKSQFDAAWNSVKPLSAQENPTLQLAVYRHNIGSFNVALSPACNSAANTEITTIVPWGVYAGLGEVPNGATFPSAGNICRQNRMVKAYLSFNIQPAMNFLPGISNSPITITHEITL